MTGFLGQGGVSPVPGAAQGNYPQYFGVYYGTVSNNADPKKRNRCLLRVPQLLGGAVTTWAVSLTPQQNTPKVGTLIACMFVGGDLDNPCYLVINPPLVVESNAANIQPVGVTSSAGTSKNLAAADHVHTLANALESTAGNISIIGTAGTAGVSAKAARGDHAHSVPDPLSVTDLAVTNTVQATTVQALGALYVPYGLAINSVSTPGINNISGTAQDANLNSNFANIVGALQAAGIWH